MGGRGAARHQGSPSLLQIKHTEKALFLFSCVNSRIGPDAQILGGGDHERVSPQDSDRGRIRRAELKSHAACGVMPGRTGIGHP